MGYGAVECGDAGMQHSKRKMLTVGATGILECRLSVGGTQARDTFLVEIFKGWTQATLYQQTSALLEEIQLFLEIIMGNC